MVRHLILAKMNLKQPMIPNEQDIASAWLSDVEIDMPSRKRRRAHNTATIGNKYDMDNPTAAKSENTDDNYVVEQCVNNCSTMNIKT